MARTVIASLAEARAALEAARSSGVAVELESPPDAASIYGVLWFAELNRTLNAEFASVPFSLTLDCGDRADLAHAALTEGIKRIRFNGHAEAAKALQDIARQVGAELVASPLQPELLYVIAEPELSRADRDWIQSIRAQHDPQFDLVGPHFTFVFGTEGPAALGMIEHVQVVARRVPPFAFELQKFEVFPGATADYYLFLMPDTGAQNLVSLHEALRIAQASDVAFVPHMTVGRFASVAEATTLADELNSKARTIPGRVSSLKVIAVAGQQLHNLATVELQGR